MENIMNLRSLAPVRARSDVARPEFGLFGSLQREIDRLFEDFTRGVAGQGNGSLMPSIDVTENDKEIEIAAEMPGLERKDVDISVEDNVLIIRGEKRVEQQLSDQQQQSDRQQQSGQQQQKTQLQQKDQQQQRDGNKNYRLAERSYGVFYRVIELPMEIDPSQVEATMANGVLRIKIRKPERSQAKKIEVKEAA
jgi:HSP20 family protein